MIPLEGEFLDFQKRSHNRWKRWPKIEVLKQKAKQAGLWNLFLPKDYGVLSPGLTNLEYAPLAEMMGKRMWISEIFNCAAPDTGNMEVLAKYGSEAQKSQWLVPLMNGDIRSAFLMTEPEVASSDATNIETSIVLDGDEYVINGQKIWTSYADKADKIFCLVRTGPQEPKHDGISFLLIDMDQPGVTTRPITLISGKSPFCETFFDDAKAPTKDLVGGLNKGWTVAKFLLSHERTSIAAVGKSISAVKKLKQIANIELNNEGSLLITDKRFRDRLTTLEMDLKALEFTELRILSEENKGVAPGPEASLLKIRGSEIQQRITELTMNAVGYYGISNDLAKSNADRSNSNQFRPDYSQNTAANYLNMRKTTIYGGSNEIQKNILSKMVLGL